MVIRKRMRIAAAVLVMCTMAGCSLFPDGIAGDPRESEDAYSIPRTYWSPSFFRLQPVPLGVFGEGR